MPETSSTNNVASSVDAMQNSVILIHTENETKNDVNLVYSSGVLRRSSVLFLGMGIINGIALTVTYYKLFKQKQKD